MPIKTDTYFGLSSPSTCFDCDELDELTKDFSGETCTAPCEDIWKKFDDFLLTPPQSPPIKFDLVSDMVDGLSDSDNALFLHNVDVLHDCMWSGQCIEDGINNHNNSKHSHSPACNSIKVCTKNHNRPDTPLNVLSTSPFTTNSFSAICDLLSTCDNDSNESRSSFDDDEDDDMMSSSQESTLSPVSSPSFVKKSLINDHSYGGFNIHSHSQQIKQIKQIKSSKFGSQSLICPSSKKVHARSRSRIKCPKINGNRIKIIKANTKSTSIATPTVKLIKKSQHMIKTVSASSSIKENHQKDQFYKFSTRRKTSTEASEKSVMFAQRHMTIEQNPNAQFNYDLDDDDSSDKSPKPQHPVRRREHNDSERKRRDHLRNAFLELKDQVPNLKSNDKRPPRILILHEATAYVHQLNEKQQYLEKTLKAEMTKRDLLLKRLSNIQNTKSINNNINMKY